MSVGGVIDVGRVDPLRDAADLPEPLGAGDDPGEDRKSTRLNSSHANTSYAVFCLKKKMELDQMLCRAVWCCCARAHWSNRSRALKMASAERPLRTFSSRASQRRWTAPPCEWHCVR